MHDATTSGNHIPNRVLSRFTRASRRRNSLDPINQNHSAQHVVSLFKVCMRGFANATRMRVCVWIALDFYLSARARPDFSVTVKVSKRREISKPF